MEMLFWQPGYTLEQVEKEAIMSAYRFYHQNKTRTSQSLKISVRTLDAKLAKYEKDAEPAKAADNAKA